MTKEEIIKVLSLLEIAYGPKKFYADTNKEAVVYLWSVMFREDDATEVNRAVVNCISTLQFAPTIADIKTRIAEARMAGQMTEMEAWDLIRKASEYSNSREESKRQFDSLPPLLRKVVGSPSQLVAWRKVDDEKFETVVASNCMRSYKELAKREAGYYALPGQIQAKEEWRIEGPKENPNALPEAPKKLNYEKPEWMIRREEMNNGRGNAESKDGNSGRPDLPERTTGREVQEGQQGPAGQDRGKESGDQTGDPFPEGDGPER